MVKISVLVKIEEMIKDMSTMGHLDIQAIKNNKSLQAIKTYKILKTNTILYLIKITMTKECLLICQQLLFLEIVN